MGSEEFQGKTFILVFAGTEAMGREHSLLNHTASKKKGGDT